MVFFNWPSSINVTNVDRITTVQRNAQFNYFGNIFNEFKIFSKTNQGLELFTFFVFGFYSVDSIFKDKLYESVITVVITAATVIKC